MDVDILDVHGKILEWLFCTRSSITDKVSLKSLRSDSATIEKLMLLHQPVHFFVIDDPTYFFKLTSHVMITITTKFLVKCFFNVLYHHPIFKELAFTIYTMARGLHSFRAS